MSRPSPISKLEVASIRYTEIKKFVVIIRRTPFFWSNFSKHQKQFLIMPSTWNLTVTLKICLPLWNRLINFMFHFTNSLWQKHFSVIELIFLRVLMRWNLNGALSLIFCAFFARIAAAEKIKMFKSQSDDICMAYILSNNLFRVCSLYVSLTCIWMN